MKGLEVIRHWFRYMRQGYVCYDLTGPRGVSIVEFLRATGYTANPRWARQRNW